jgi:hypothetical protein
MLYSYENYDYILRFKCEIDRFAKLKVNEYK